MNRISVTALVLCLVLTSFFAAGALSLAQDRSTPSANGTFAEAYNEDLFIAEGVSAPISARAEVNGLDVSDPHLVLERIRIPEATRIGRHTTSSPELLLVEEGGVVL